VDKIKAKKHRLSDSELETLIWFLENAEVSFIKLIADLKQYDLACFKSVREKLKNLAWNRKQSYKQLKKISVGSEELQRRFKTLPACKDRPGHPLYKLKKKSMSRLVKKQVDI